MAYTLDTIYSHIYDSNDVVFGPWEQWFAWRPVKMLYWYTDDIFPVEHPMKIGKTVWLTPLIRRRITPVYDAEFDDTYEGMYSLPRRRWQYTTFEELMRWG